MQISNGFRTLLHTGRSNSNVQSTGKARILQIKISHYQPNYPIFCKLQMMKLFKRLGRLPHQFYRLLKVSYCSSSMKKILSQGREGVLRLPTVSTIMLCPNMYLIMSRLLDYSLKIFFIFCHWENKNCLFLDTLLPRGFSRY